MQRYDVIRAKRPREIVLLRTTGCRYRACTFCDYHLDRSDDASANLALNRAVLERLTGEYGEVEVINSGSVFDFDDAMLDLIAHVCRERGISTIHFESHWIYRRRIPALRERFAGFELKMKLGLETFDADLRERVLRKGIRETDPAAIAEGFQEANFLFGLPGQTASSMEHDVELGLAHFERVCLNVMCENTTPVRPDPQVVDAFLREVAPRWQDDPRVDVLASNTDFGVGAPEVADPEPATCGARAVPDAPALATCEVPASPDFPALAHAVTREVPAHAATLATGETPAHTVTCGVFARRAQAVTPDAE